MCFDASSQRDLVLVSEGPGGVNARKDRFQSINNALVLLLKILTGGWQTSSRRDVPVIKSPPPSHHVGPWLYASLIYVSHNLDDCRLPVLNLSSVGSWKAIRK